MTSKRIWFFFVAVGLISGLTTAQRDLPPLEGKALWTYITVTDPYMNWKHWPGYEGMYPGETHAPFLKLFVNDRAYEAIQSGRLPLPDGSIIVKENYDKDKITLKVVSPMYKVKNYNPEGGDWFWAKYGTEGSIEAAGEVRACIDCHKKKKDQDWLFTKMNSP